MPAPQSTASRPMESLDVRGRKKILRREFLSKRAAIPRAERDRISREVVKKFLATEIFRTSEIIMAYVSAPDELQLTELLAECLAAGKILAVPFIAGKGIMRAVQVPTLDALEPDAFNIPTVKRQPQIFIEPAHIDCVIVPGAAFDIHGGRLGLGGGYYDRFLPQAVNAVKVAFAYDFQLVDSLPTEAHDAFVDIILTAKT